MKCDYCGVVNLDGADYCRGCGKQLDNNQNGKEGNVPVNEKKNVKKTPLNELENKCKKWSYCIFILTISLVFACFLPFVYNNADRDYSATIIELLPETNSYQPTTSKSLNGAEVGALLVLACSFLGVFFALKRKPTLLNSVLLSNLFWVWLICDTVGEWYNCHDYVLGVGGWYYCIMPIIICCMSIKQYNLQKTIKEYTLYYKAKGIMEYTADDFIPCPFCNQNEFVRDVGHCRNCGAEFDCGARDSIFISLLINAVSNIFAAIICSNSYWITMFELDINTYYTEIIDNRMSICYWILAAGFLVIAVLPFKQRKVLKFAFPVLSVIMSSIQALHIWNLSHVVPTRYENSSQIALATFIVMGLMELVMILRNLKKAESYFGKK